MKEKKQRKEKKGKGKALLLICGVGTRNGFAWSAQLIREKQMVFPFFCGSIPAYPALTHLSRQSSTITTHAEADLAAADTSQVSIEFHHHHSRRHRH